MTLLIIFTAKYLILLSPILVLWAFYKAPKEERGKIIIFAVLTLFLSYVVALIARHFWYDPRPFVIGGFPPLIPHTADNGFPSDHALLAAALAVVVQYFDKKMAVVLWLVAALIGVARVIAQVHHPIDILGSFAIALGMGIAAHAIIGQLWKSKQISF